MGSEYSDPRYGVKETICIPSYQSAVQTSVIASNTNFARMTLMKNVTVKDFNINFLAACTASGATSEAWRIALGYSLAGTGTVTAIGTATVGSGSNQAAGSVLDASVTETNLSAGDDLVAMYLAGTALPAGTSQINCVQVSVQERFA